MGIPIHMDSQNIMPGLILNNKFNHMVLAMNQSLNKNILLDINHMSFFQFLEHNNQSYISLDKMTLPHRNDLKGTLCKMFYQERIDTNLQDIWLEQMFDLINQLEKLYIYHNFDVLNIRILP